MGRTGRRQNPPTVAQLDRLSGLDASFLALEEGGAHMHVGSVLVFDGPAPAYVDFLAKLESRLHLVPRYRQKLAVPPLVQSRPVWVDDPHFNARYHIRHTGLPGDAGDEELKRLAGRVFAQRLDRSKPLWEIWLVDRVAGGRFALVCKTHHALVDGISGVDITSVLFDLDPDPPEAIEPARPWYPRPEPSATALLADALGERAELPLDAARAARDAVVHPERSASRLLRALGGLGSMAAAGLGGAPPSPLNVAIGPHRRFDWVEAELDEFRAIKTALGGTVNDVVLTVVAGALRSHWHARGFSTEEVELKAMVPISVRGEDDRGALGNRVAAMWAPLPLHPADPLERYRIVEHAMRELKRSGQAVGAGVMTRLTGFTPPTVLQQAARLQAVQRFFNLTVTNVPGPQVPLYLMGRRMVAFHPQVPLAANTALGIAIMSYDGRMSFGLLADYDAVGDLADFAAGLREAIAELAQVAGLPARPAANGRAPRRARARSAPAAG